MFATRNDSLPANTSNPAPANRSSIARVLFQSPEESLTPAIAVGKSRNNRSIRSRLMPTCDTGGM